ncbi:alpha/beta-hydrolase [Clathrospora elynae]|uniref:Alpha/beta-hydrolase n=1 Tax=Clathrospora elynae TaxID=706981 RepID=A0A6A5S9J7_9PLEO|nr:alpha/beta-hydrolase [Clathrospora elynae]
MSETTTKHNDHEIIKLSSGTVAHIWHPPPQSPPRAVIILQHGYAEYAERYLTSHHNIISHLTAAGYAVYAMDIWGHGRSPGTRGVAHIGKAVSDHLSLRKLAASLAKPVILLGHSLGGLITAGSVTGNGAGIAGVVLTGPAFPLPIPWVGRVVVGAVVRAMPTVSVPGRSVPIEGLTRDMKELEKYWADPSFYKKGICFLLAATALDVAETVRAGLKDWSVPTLLLHGNADKYCDWKESEKFVEGIKSADKEFGVYEDGRHELLHDLEGDAVLKRIMEWIDGRV